MTEFNRYLTRTVADHRSEDPDWHQYFEEFNRDELAQRRSKLERDSRPHEVIEAGHEIPLDALLSRTRAGRYDQKSIAGKVATLVEELGGELKAGEATYYSGDKITETVVSKEGTKSTQLNFKRGEVKTHRWLAAVVDSSRTATNPDVAVQRHYVEVVGSVIFLDRTRIVKLSELVEIL